MPVNDMGTRIGIVREDMIAEMVIDAMLTGDLLSKTAKLYRKFHKELTSEGFTADQALQLITKLKMPGGEK